MATFQFKIQLANISKPPVWRRVQVSASYSFEQLHDVIQTIFPWYNCHLFQFSPQGYGSNPVIALENEDDWDKPDLEASETLLSQVFKTEGQKFVYIYDFGDDWIHKITLEKIIDENILRPVCIAGKGACPPEDCGGPWGYEALKETLSDPSSEEYEDLCEWMGLEEDEIFDPKFFRVEDANDFLVEEFK